MALREMTCFPIQETWMVTRCESVSSSVSASNVPNRVCPLWANRTDSHMSALPLCRAGSYAGKVLLPTFGSKKAATIRLPGLLLQAAGYPGFPRLPWPDHMSALREPVFLLQTHV